MDQSNLHNVCRDFMKGKCERENCRFVHDTKLCKRFHENWMRKGKGTCKYGEHCRKKHYVNVENNVVKKQRNTESWQPPQPPYDMKVQIEPKHDKLSCKLTPYDVLVAQNVFYDFQNGALHDKLVTEIKNCNNEKEDLLKLWHGSKERGIEGTHHIANDRTNWKKDCPTFELVVNRMVEFFGVKPAATRLNWYKTHDEYKSFHFDSAYVNPEKAKTQNITIAVSFGQTRDIVFENAKSKQKICFEQGDNDVYVFMNEINSTWRHGVSRGKNDDKNSSRVSIIIWGWIDGVN